MVRIALTLLVLQSVAAIASPSSAGFPRIASQWGLVLSPTTSLSVKDYDEWARFDLLVAAGGTTDSWRQVSRELRSRNPRILVLKTQTLTNVHGSPAWMRDDWYLRRPDGSHVTYWSGQIRIPNITIDECLQAVVAETAKVSGQLLREGLVDGLFFDSVVPRITYFGDVDADRDGRVDKPSEIDSAWHARQQLIFRELRKQFPGLLIVINDGDCGHAPVVNGRLLEGQGLLDMVASGLCSGRDAVNALQNWSKSVARPNLTFALMCSPMGIQEWRQGKGGKANTSGEVSLVGRDFRRMRLGLCTALMSDAYYGYDWGTSFYGYRFWYAEYDAPLGEPLGPAKEIVLGRSRKPVTVFDWKAGGTPEQFSIHPAGKATNAGISVTLDDARTDEWQTVFSTDRTRLNLKPGGTYRVRAACSFGGQVPEAYFIVRSKASRWRNAKANRPVYFRMSDCSAPASSLDWKIDAVFTLDNLCDYALEWNMRGKGGITLKSLLIEEVNETYFTREFEGGMVVLNPTNHLVTVALKRPMRRLNDGAAPRHELQFDDDSDAFSTGGAWAARSGEGHYFNHSYHVASGAGHEARWTFKAPSSDVYTFYANAPGGNNLTASATYSVSGPGKSRVATIDQRSCDGGWVKLFDASLQAGAEYALVLKSGETGETAADAVRIESRARLNDGSAVESVTIDPLDGAILLRDPERRHVAPD